MTVHMERKIAVRQLHRISIVPRPQSAVTKPCASVESVKFWIARVDTITGEVPKWLKPYITDTMAIGTYKVAKARNRVSCVQDLVMFAPVASPRGTELQVRSE